MKQKIYIKRFNKDIELPKIIAKGDWVDLRSAEDITLKAPIIKNINRSNKVDFSTTLIPLGVAMLLPDGMEANVVARSGTFKNYGIMQINTFAVIDGGKFGYNGPNDEWKFQAVALKNTIIPVNERVCQFRIQLSQKATIWQKLKWLFTNGIEIIEVDNLPEKEDRGGFSTTGTK
jgi:dUTP pyrophosphatase